MWSSPFASRYRRIVTWGLLAALVLVAVLLSSAFPQFVLRLLWHRYVFHHGLQLQVIASGLEVPWALAFLPDNRLLVAERPGRLRIVEADGTLSPPLGGLPAVLSRGEGGLMDVVVAPDFAQSARICWTYSEAAPDGGSGTSAACGQLEGHRLVNVGVIFRQAATDSSSLHYGSRLHFMPDGRVLLALGDRWRRDEAQELATTHGKIIRLGIDGSSPTDNPFVHVPGADLVWTYGHRNVQGLAKNSLTGSLWASEHGPQGGDEINLIAPGRNYGWPVITHGCEYNTCEKIGEGTAKAGMEQPLLWFGPDSAALTGMAFVTSDRYPDWKGQLLVGTMRRTSAVRVKVRGDEVLGYEPMWFGRYRRVRDIKQGPDGWLYVAAELPEGVILRLVP